MKQITLFSLVNETRFGGSTTFTAHLTRSLEEAGWNVHIVRVGKKTFAGFGAFTHGLHYQNMSLPDAVALSRGGPSLITYAHWKTHAEATQALLAEGVPLVMHDPAEFHGALMDALKKHSTRVATIRRWTAGEMKKLGVAATFIPHPYMIFAKGVGWTPERNVNAVALGRVDFRKRHDIVVQANRVLAPPHQIHIWGADGRVFSHHILDKKWPGWRDNYRGSFPPVWEGALLLLKNARHAIDLTDIRGGDGDGTQYSFLEAWEARTPLIVNQAWVKTGKDSMRPDENCLAVRNHEELAQVLTSGRDLSHLVEGGARELLKHDPNAVVPPYLALMGAS